jgi:hypothetical protein
MAMNVQLDPRYEVSNEPHLSEEEASQGRKTGHIRWVLAIGFALACIGVAATALIQA